MRHTLTTRRLVALPLALAVAACQGQPVVLLDDPDLILAAALASTTAATSVHLDLTAEGTVALDPLGTGAGAPIDLRDTTAAADLDLRTGRSRTTFSSPGLLGIAGEAIVVEDAMYIKTTFTGPLYTSTVLPQPPENPLRGLTDLLGRTDLDPVKGADAPCAGGSCYALTIRLTPDKLAGLGGAELPTDLPIPLPDVSDAAIDLTLHVEQSTTRLAGITAAVDLGDLGDVALQATFTRWNESVSIVAPPGDQVGGTG